MAGEGNMSDEPGYQVITPANTLRAKVTALGGPNLETIIAQAESAIAALRDDFEASVREDLAGLNRRVGAMGHAADAATIEDILRVCYNLRAQAETFGYPLLLRIAESLCRFLAQSKARRRSEVIRAHVDGLAVVVDRAIRGDGGEQGRELIGALEALVAKTRSG